MYSKTAPLACTPLLSTAEELWVNHTLFAVSIARLRGLVEVPVKMNDVFTPLTRTFKVLGLASGVPVGLISARPPGPLLLLRTHTLPLLSTATSSGLTRNVVAESEYLTPSVQSVGTVPGQPPVLEKAGVAVTNPQIAAKLVGYAVAFVLVGFKLM